MIDFMHDRYILGDDDDDDDDDDETTLMLNNMDTYQLIRLSECLVGSEILLRRKKFVR